MKTTLISTMLIFLIAGSAAAANLVDIRINSGDTLWRYEVSSFDIWIENDIQMGGFTLGFKIWSDDGATWSWDVGDYSEEGQNVYCDKNYHVCRSLVIDSRMYPWPFDMVGALLTTYQNVDEIGYDSILSFGVGLMQYMEPGPLEHMYSYYFVAGGEELSSICVDSCFVPPSGAFVFVDTYGAIYTPTVLWEHGGRCWPVKTSYICGDVNGDGDFNVGDPIFLIAFIFRGGPEPWTFLAGDANGDGKVDIGDAVYMLQNIFQSGPDLICP